MAYKKFDDASAGVSQAVRKVGPAMPWEAIRRAIQSVTNRVMSGTNGTFTGTGGIGAIWLGTGGTAGIRATPLALCINGRYGTFAGDANIYLPKGTQGKSTYVKYLVAANFGTAVVVAGNEGATSTAALLPDCPDGFCAIGYMEYATGTSGGYVRFGGGTAGGYNILSGKTAGTEGTVNDWESLLHMPYDEA